MQELRSIMRVGMVALAAMLGACGGGTEPDPDPGPIVLAISSGNAQSAEAGEAVAQPLIVSVTQDGAPRSGVAITWTVTGGGGSVNPTSGTTSAAGTASTTWTLGSTAGANAVQASATGATGSPATFTATATQPPAPPPMQADVDVDDTFFDPSTQRVAVGGTVTWTWVGSLEHSVTFPAGTSSATQTVGTFQRTFPTAGSFGYQCAVHSGMTGAIVVE